jgi:TonB family protein
MEVTLIESGRRTGKSLFGGSIPSLVVHASIIGGAVFASLNARPGNSQVAYDTTLVLVAPTPERQQPVQAEPELNVAVKGFQTVSVPVIVPTNIPPVSLQEHFDPKDFSGVGVEGGRADGVEPAPNQVYEESAVDELPRLLAAPPPEYPLLLRDAGITGRVVLQAVIDTTGRVDPATVKVVQSPNPGFEVSSRRWILRALFRPARIRGRAVRVLVNMPLDFSIAGRSGG